MQNLTIKNSGLKTYSNRLSEVKPGSLVQADNVVLDREAVIEPRRGYNSLPGTLSTTLTDRANQIFKFEDNLISHYGVLNAPTKLAFYAPTVTITGSQVSASNVISNLNSIENLYVNQYVTVDTIEQSFTGSIVLGTNQITNVASVIGLYVGQFIGGTGIPANTTITAISGAGPFTLTISDTITYTNANAGLSASNANLLGIPVNTTITAVGPSTITLSTPVTISSRTFTFSPSDVDIVEDQINVLYHGLVEGQTVEFTSSGTLPAGLTAGVIYYVINVADDYFQVSLTEGGNAVDITTQGTGTHTATSRNSIRAYGWIDYAGTYNQPDTATKLRSVEANNNVYFTTSTGIQKLDSLTSVIVPAGAPKGLDGFAILSDSSSGFMPNDTQVAYRVVWGYKDLNQNLVLGAPSQRILVSNSTGETKDVNLNITIPQEVTTSYFYQIYRSGFSASAQDEPNDEMSLVYEANPTSLDLTNEYLIVTDETPESLRNGATLYTSPSQEGILQANEPPPFAKDVTLFKGSTFYANTKTKQNLTLSILSVSSQFNIFGNTTNVVGDTPTTIRNLSYSIVGTLTAGSNQITGIADTGSLYEGQTISDTTNPSYIPTGTVITEIVSSSVITISNPATTSSIGDTLSIGVAGLLIGQLISGTGIPSSTTVTEIYSAFTSIGDTTIGSPTVINIASTTGFKVGQIITGAGIPVNTTVLNIPTNTSITLSKNATATAAAVTLTLEEGFQISNAATAVGSNVTLTLKNGLLGIQFNDTLTIAGITYTAKLVENVANKEFKIYAQGSPAQNIGDTAQSLIRVVNRTTSPAPTIYAYYLSGFNALPGKILFQERSFGGGIFYATANSTSAGAAYSPNLPASGTTVGSQNDQFQNGLYFSKTQQPDAVPLLNFTKVGSAHAAILRIIPLRDSLFILKEDGIFRLTGESPTSFRVDLFDSTTQILAAESAVSLNNLIFMFSRYGIVTVSDTGVTVISRPIEDKMLDLLEIDQAKVRDLSFGISYESDRKYIFYSITTSTDTSCTQAYVYNTFTETWTRYVRNQTCGIVQPVDDLLYMGDATENIFDIERKSRSFTDYTDTSFEVTLSQLTGTTTLGSSIITSIANTSYFERGDLISGIGIPPDAQIIDTGGSTITLNKVATSSGVTTLLLNEGKSLIINSLADVEVGDALWQSDGRYSIISAINDITQVITVNDYINDWVSGPASILKAFSSIIKYVPQTSQNPGNIKQFRETTLLFQVPYFNNITLSFDTDLSSGPESVLLQGLYGDQWGRFPWGNIPWGGITKPIPLRTYVPQQKQRCSLLNIAITHREAYSYYRLNGLSFIHGDLNERVAK